MGYVHAKPLKIVEIRNIAQDVRRFLKLSDNERINAPKLLDALCVLWEDYGFQYMVMPDDDPVFEKGEEAKTDISSGMIYFKESVMYKACHHKYKRAPFTICHEIGHFVLHRMLGGVSLARSTNERRPRAFEDPERQAWGQSNSLMSGGIPQAYAYRNRNPWIHASPRQPLDIRRSGR